MTLTLLIVPTPIFKKYFQGHLKKYSGAVLFSHLMVNLTEKTFEMTAQINYTSPIYSTVSASCLQLQVKGHRYTDRKGFFHFLMFFVEIYSLECAKYHL